MSEKIYFVSDLHLGIPNHQSSLEREKKFVRWLKEIEKDASALYLMGDLFDFWHEYKHAVPKGYTRILGKLAELADRGLPIYYFKGNHDLWMKDYFQKEIGVVIYDKPIARQFGSKKVYLAHGDGLGPGDKGYKFIKSIFTNSFFQWCFKWIHPDVGIALGLYFSKRSRHQEGGVKDYQGNENEHLYNHCVEVLKKEHFDYFVFGHRHIPLEVPVNENSTYINLGDWITHFSYAVFENDSIRIEKFSS